MLKAGEAQSPAALSYKHSRRTTLGKGWKGINGKVRGKAGGFSGREWPDGGRGEGPGNLRRGSGARWKEGVERDKLDG